MTNRTKRETAVAELSPLPLYQLSTAGMELFHTNILYWLAAHRPDESAPLWASLGLGKLRLAQHRPLIRREWRHLDLVFLTSSGQPMLVVENKIGAIPTPDQLLRYQTDVSRGIQATGQETGYVLLTLTPPAFAIPEPWRSVTYRELLPALRETADRLAGDEAVLLSSYAEMVARLDTVAWLYDPARTLHEPAQLSNAERLVLSDARLLSLVEKVRVGRFADLATQRVVDALGASDAVESGLSSGSGINDWFISGPDGWRFGWQIQSGQFRLAVVTPPQSPMRREEREGLVQDRYEPFFDFTTPEHLSHTLRQYTGRKPWLGYEPNFVYRYATISPGTTWDELLALAVWFSRRTQEFLDRTR